MEKKQKMKTIKKKLSKVVIKFSKQEDDKN